MTLPSDRKVLVLGAGGHGRVIADAAMRAGFGVVGFVDPKYSQGTEIMPALRVLGDDDWVLYQDPKVVLLALGVGPLPGRRLRRDLYVAWAARGYILPSIVHPGAILAEDVRVGAGCQVMAGAVVQTATHMGDDVTVNTRASVDHGCVIEAHVHIAPGAILCGDVYVGEAAHVGPGAIVLPGVRIGHHSTIRPGTVVRRDVEDGGVAC